jgi:hypothetical protein
VREQVRLEVAALVEAALAHRALVWRLLQVQYLVHGQRARLTESLAAFRALERLLLGMNVPETTTTGPLVTDSNLKLTYMDLETMSDGFLTFFFLLPTSDIIFI